MNTNEPAAATSASLPIPDNFHDIEQEIRSSQITLAAFNSELRVSSQLGNQFGRALGTAFAGLAVQGKSLNQVLSTLALSLSKMVFSAAFKPLEQAIGGAFSSLLSAPALFAPQGKLAAPAAFPVFAGNAAAASGAFASASQVGASSAVSPLASASGGPGVVFNIQTPDVESFRRSETQLAAMLARAVAQGQRNL